MSEQCVISVVLIDDEEHVLGLYTRAVETVPTDARHQIRCQSIRATHEQNPLSVLESSGDVHHLLIVDMHMPDVTGMDIIERTSRWPQHRDCSYIIITGDTTSTNRNHGSQIAALKQRLGDRFMGILAKPVGVDKIRELVINVSERCTCPPLIQ